MLYYKILYSFIVYLYLFDPYSLMCIIDNFNILYMLKLNIIDALNGYDNTLISLIILIFIFLQKQSYWFKFKVVIHDC